VHVTHAKASLDLVHELAALSRGSERSEVEAQARVRETADLLHSHFSIAVGYEVKVGQPHEEIARCAESHGAELIVVGAQREHFIADLLVGATTSRLLRCTAKPVLVVRQPPIDSCANVIVGIDFSQSSRSALRYARSLAPSAAIWALHVLETDQAPDEAQRGGQPPESEWRPQTKEATALLKRFVHRDFGSASPAPLVEPGYPPQIICGKSERMKASLICIGKHGLHETSPGLLGSIAKHVLERASCDVVVVSV